MSINCITPNSSFSYCPAVSGIDSEEKEIIKRLLAYGYTPTGDKATDKAHLRKIELEKAKQDNYVSDKYLTVSTAECRRIQERKKEKLKINNPEKKTDIHEKRQGAKILGDQIFQAIKMKQDKKIQKPEEEELTLKKAS